ncbi:histidine kinase [Novosphingobium endophyticum]|uniref:histidine kinase n=1 Tax=Novosphingobium endophyticum TaxID=1955250 RepID=A0A916TPQ8_9SPHN|nr:CHASE2 domain-containing protein [Novosphingobium endophyticum]GGB89883.1 histidine kinase [Novosphingobium endophyticum]
MKLAIRLRRLATEWWLVALLSSVFVLALVHTRATERLDDLAYDALLQLEVHAPDPRILLVVIDDRSLREIGRWPWPREAHARLLDRIASGHPRAIAYDVLFVEPGPGDAQLGQAISRAGPVFLPIVLAAPDQEGARLEPMLPVPPIRRAATGLGHVNLLPDPDGVIRRARLFEADGDRRWPHLMELVSRYVDPHSKAPEATESAGAVLLPFAGPAGHFPAIGADAVLRGELPPELLRDRIVMVGATASGLGDHYAVPLSGIDGGMSGVEIQANLLDGLLRGTFTTESSLAVRALAALMPLWLLLLALRRFGPRTTMLVLGGLIALVTAFSAGAFHFFATWIPPTPALVGLVLVYPLWGWRRLVGVNSYMVHELERLRGEPELLPSLARPNASTDPVTREAMLLGDAVSKLRTMRRFVADSMDQLPDAVFVVDREGSIALANRYAQNLLHAASPNEEGRLVALLQWLQPIGDGGALRWPPPGAGGRHEALAPDGRVFDIWLSEHRDDKGRAAGWILRMSDVSAIRMAQRQRDDMLHYLTHDMRSPQASILALTSSAKADDIAAGLAQRIERYARRTLALADGMVHLARAETLNYEPVPLNLADLLIEAVDELWPQIGEKGLSVELIGTDRSVPVLGERSLLTRALINLVDNGVKFSPDRGHLKCSVLPGRAGGIPVANCLISDQGEGMAPELLATLFERFRRGPAGRYTRGSGLGLAFVQAVAARHGGLITCDSAIGAGTTFTLSLPLVAESDL